MADVILLMAQIDDAPGEVLGRVMAQMGEMGARNVQLLSSLGKKGRPAYVLLIDILAENEDEFAALLVSELGLWGYRVLQSQHKHFEIRRYALTVALTLAGERRIFPMRIKRILKDGQFMRAKAEHDDLATMARQLPSARPVPLAVLKAAVETALSEGEPPEILEIRLRDLTEGDCDASSS